MKTILITGATGNVGSEVIKSIESANAGIKILAGVKDIEPYRGNTERGLLRYVHFDFEDEQSMDQAIASCQILFLLRPPQLANIRKYFKPVIRSASIHNIEHIVFLSVQGAEHSTLIPHHKIEKLIRKSGIPYTFLRPAYFMQNFTTTLRKELVENNLICLPAGEAKFTLVDVAEVGAVAAKVLLNYESHVNQAYDLTNEEQLSFGEMVKILSEALGRDIRFESPSLISFFIKKRKEQVPFAFIFVMIMLHYFPRFGSTPSISNWVEKVSGVKPKTFRAFVEANRANLA